MKTLKQRITKSNNGSQFTDHVKYTMQDWKNFKILLQSKYEGKYMIANYEGDKDLELVYLISDDKLEHVATYNTKKEELYTDDISMFGHVKK